MSKSTSPKRRRRDKDMKTFTEVCAESGGKLKFNSRKRALTAMNAQRQKASKEGRTAPCAIYVCWHCGAFHMTSRQAKD